MSTMSSAELMMKEKMMMELPEKPLGTMNPTMGLDTITIPNAKITTFEGLGVMPQLKTLFLQGNFIRLTLIPQKLFQFQIDFFSSKKKTDHSSICKHNRN